MIDSFYTPVELAEKLVGFVSEENINSVCDFCVGDGELLRAAQKKWVNAIFYGTDLSEDAINKVIDNHPNWWIRYCNFIDEESRNTCELLLNNNRFDLVLLNPPFSCKASCFHKVTLNGLVLNVSTAMKFIIESINYLSQNGALYAIVPSSIIYSQKDKVALRILVNDYKFKVLYEPTKQYFQKCDPSIAIISINSRYNTSIIQHVPKLKIDKPCFTFLRGNVPMNIAKTSLSGMYNLVHTTNIRNNSLHSLNISITKESSTVSGPAVLIPRVGQPNINKVCFINADETYVLSDCVIAIQTESEEAANLLKEAIIQDEINFYNLYKGTGASYLTIERLKNYLM